MRHLSNSIRRITHEAGRWVGATPPGAVHDAAGRGKRTASYYDRLPRVASHARRPTVRHRCAFITLARNRDGSRPCCCRHHRCQEGEEMGTPGHPRYVATTGARAGCADDKYDHGDVQEAHVDGDVAVGADHGGHGEPASPHFSPPRSARAASSPHAHSMGASNGQVCTTYSCHMHGSLRQCMGRDVANAPTCHRFPDDRNHPCTLRSQTGNSQTRGPHNSMAVNRPRLNSWRIPRHGRCWPTMAGARTRSRSPRTTG